MLWKLKKERLGHPAGEVVEAYKGYDYGLCNDDERGTGVKHVTVKTANGGKDEPFFTVPVDDLEAC